MVAVTVVGAGVVGLATAVALAEAGHGVTVVADHVSPYTLSDGAGAIWNPVYCGASNDIPRWAMETLRRLQALQDDEPAAGVRTVAGEWRTEGDLGPRPYWADALPEYRRLEPAELAAADGRGAFGSGCRFATPIVDSPTYLQFLLDRLEALGGRVARARLARLSDAPTNVVVNCAGMGARALTGDGELVGARGQLLRVYAPHWPEFRVAERASAVTYVLPRANGEVVLGGTHQVGDERADSDDAEVEAIKRRVAVEVDADLPRAPEVVRWSGLRPERPSGPRVESERVGAQLVVHNYGHGGSGFTLHWGCADDVVALVARSKL